MRAFNVAESGAPPELSDIAVPEVTAGTVLVRVAAAGLNPIDNTIAAGHPVGMLPYEYPVVIGRDAAGVVEAVGAGVDHVAVGDEVLGHVRLAPPIHAGTLAEYALLPGEAVAGKPAGVDFTTAAALPLAGAAAATAVDALNVEPGQVVLVSGATGGAGTIAVQLLAAHGVTVLATGRGAADAALLTSLGAHKVYDRTARSVTDQVVADHPGGVHGLIEFGAQTPQDSPLGAVRIGGKVAALTQAGDPDLLTAAWLRGGSMMAVVSRDVLERLIRQVADGSLKIRINQVLPLDRAADGLAVLAAGHARGRTVVAIA